MTEDIGWIFMWAMAFAIFFGCKWMTWRRACQSGCHPSVALSLGYLFAWPGMDAMAFCATSAAKPKSSLVGTRSTASLESLPGRSGTRWNASLPDFIAACDHVRLLQHRIGAWSLKFEVWSFAAAKTIIGALVIWMAAHGSFGLSPLFTGWLAMIGLVMFLHFGLFHLLALGWRAAGVAAQPIMRAPLAATSLAQFWGRRWNTAFHTLAHDLLFLPLVSRWGAAVAGIGVFLISGLIHETVISLPARGGFGLPTAYFGLQSLGVLAERSRWGRRFGLGRGFRGWLFVVLCAGAPAFWLFHPVFIRNVILPMLRAIGTN